MLKDMGPPSIRAKLFPDEPVQGRNRLRLLEQTGKVQVPYLIDPNIDIEMFESSDIMIYLNQTYAL
jgi:glutathione S-transferase